MLHLANDEIHLWLVRPSLIQDEALLYRYRRLLLDEEMASSLKFKSSGLRHAALITRVFVRCVCSAYADLDPERWRFIKNAYGKPELVEHPIPLRFNLSHSGDVIICAVVLNHDIGSDVEQIQPGMDVTELARDFFSLTEYRQLLAVSSLTERHKRFFDYWTLKESYIKARGLGLELSLDQFSFEIGTPDDVLINSNVKISFARSIDERPDTWQSWLIRPHNTYRIAMSVNCSANTPFHLRFFHAIPLQEHTEHSSPL